MKHRARILPLLALLLSLMATACGGAPPTPATPLPSATSLPPSPVPLVSATPFSPQPTPTDTPAPTSTSTSVPSAFADPGAYQWQVVASGLDEPDGMANAGDGSGRLFILEQPGVIRILQNGQLLPQPFLDLRSQVGTNGNERGLLGLAFHPGYKDGGYFYVDYTNLSGNIVIARYQVSSGDPNQADPASGKILLQIAHPSFPNHNGGNLVFGPDGYLYIGVGDGGSQGDPNNHGQSTNILLGKILRIDVDHGDPYAIPPDNPFANGGGLPEIWAYGLRNPWRFSFDAQTGDLYIGDVGQDQWEEIDFLPAGSPGGTNFGWSYREGLHPYKGQPPAGLNLVDPVYEYSHSYGCAVIGGYVYRGSQLPAWQGIYVFGDECSGNVWGLQRTPEGAWQGQMLYTTQFSITSFGVDESGELYLLDRNGNVARLAAK